MLFLCRLLELGKEYGIKFAVSTETGSDTIKITGFTIKKKGKKNGIVTNHVVFFPDELKSFDGDVDETAFNEIKNMMLNAFGIEENTCENTEK